MTVKKLLFRCRICWRYTIPCFSFGNVRELSIVLFFHLMNSAAVRCGIFVVVVRYSRCVVHVHASLHAAYVFLSKAACALPLHACVGNPDFVRKGACRGLEAWGKVARAQTPIIIVDDKRSPTLARLRYDSVAAASMETSMEAPPGGLPDRGPGEGEVAAAWGNATG